MSTPTTCKGESMRGKVNGDVAQLGEHYTCTVGVVGSNPIISTMVVEDRNKTAC